MTGPSLTSTVCEAGAASLLPIPDGSDVTQVFGAGLIPPPNLGDSPPKKACNKKSARGAKRNDNPTS